jgi:hypothetical protein
MLQFLIEADIYRPILAILTIASIVIPVATLEGVGGGVARALSIVLGLELIALGFHSLNP